VRAQGMIATRSNKARINAMDAASIFLDFDTRPPHENTHNKYAG
jgi:hypothetical protein